MGMNEDQSSRTYLEKNLMGDDQFNMSFEDESVYGIRHYGSPAGMEEVSHGMATYPQDARKTHTVAPSINMASKLPSRQNPACGVIYSLLLTCFLVNVTCLFLIHFRYGINDLLNSKMNDVITPHDDALNGNAGPRKFESLRRLMSVESNNEMLEEQYSNEVIRKSPFINFTTGAKSEWDRLQKGISVGEIKFTINQPNMCNENAVLVIMVSSAIDNVQKRRTIRETWGSVTNSNPPGSESDDSMMSRLVFLVGKPQQEDGISQVQITEENRKHQDIIQTNIADSYVNLSFKSIAMLTWMTRHCKSAEYLLKTDDDMFINVERLKSELSNSVHKRFIMGEIIAGAEPMKDKDSKWYTPHELYPHRLYPKYVSGSAYVLSGDLISDLYVASITTKVFWLEDVYLTGICAKNINAEHIYSSKFGYKKRRLSPCVFKNIVTCHRLSSNEMYRIWNALQNPNLTCG